jgi:hypothetical protein
LRFRIRSRPCRKSRPLLYLTSHRSSSDSWLISTALELREAIFVTLNYDTLIDRPLFAYRLKSPTTLSGQFRALKAKAPPIGRLRWCRRWRRNTTDGNQSISTTPTGTTGRTSSVDKPYGAGPFSLSPSVSVGWCPGERDRLRHRLRADPLHGTGLCSSWCSDTTREGQDCSGRFAINRRSPRTGPQLDCAPDASAPMSSPSPSA